MAPQYTIVSVGSKPGADAGNKYRQYSVTAFGRQRWRGSITLAVNPDGSGNLASEYQREDANAPA